MWRREEKSADGTAADAAVSISDLHETATGVEIAHAAEAERTRLRAEAADFGGPSPLVSFRDGPESGIDISKAHPGSLPQFITGKSTLLSNLFRDEVGLRTARLAAERITAKNTELRTVRGIEAVHLAVGVARWRIGGAGFAAPVLLRPLAIRRHHSDFELKLQGAFEVNPELVRIAREHFGLSIDAAALAALAYDGGIFKPQPVIDSLRAMTRSIDTFSVEPRLVVSTFADVSGAMSRDGGSLDHVLLNALGGHVGDRERVTAPRATPHHTGPDDRSPASDNLLLDADAEQEAVLARVAAGHSLTVATLPGTGGRRLSSMRSGSWCAAGSGSWWSRHVGRLSTVSATGSPASDSTVSPSLPRACGATW
ncbi:hypothetical protein [Microbacterium sp. Se63.02b]|uniref:hypothetical protein n=1 Tax=Microbacterium sp. Se63.02b TaxID=2709304 RepID=UPI001FCEFC74|nr:hypothetical protein [Microbacterium sp. Se63.02b]